MACDPSSSGIFTVAIREREAALADLRHVAAHQLHLPIGYVEPGDCCT